MRPPASEPRTSQSPLDYFGSGTFDDNHFGEPGADLALDDGRPGEPFGNVLDSFGSGTFESPELVGDFDLLEGSTAAAAQAVQAHSQQPKRPWPTGESPELEALEIDPLSVSRQAGYGEPPESPLLAMAYAVRVFRTRRQLTRRAVDLAARLETIERERDEALGAFARDHRTALERHETTGPLYGAVQNAERALGESRKALAGANAQYDRLSTELTRKLAVIDEDLKQKQRVAEGHAAELAERRAELRRLEGLTERLFAELAPIADAEERQGGSLRPGQMQKAAELEKQIADLKAQTAARKERATAAESALTSAQRARAEAERLRRDAERERSALTERFRTQIGAQTEGLTRAEADLRRRLADVTRRALALRGQVPFDDRALDALLGHDRAVHAAAVDLETVRRGIDDYDEGPYRRGWWMAAGIAALLVLLFVWLLI